MVWYVTPNITIELIYPLMDCCHNLSVYWFYEHEIIFFLKHCFRYCHYYKSNKQAFQINLYCFHTVKPKLVTQPAIVYGFFMATAANDPDWPTVG